MSLVRNRSVKMTACGSRVRKTSVSSSARILMFSGTATPPAVMAPNWASTDSAQFGSKITTRPPARTPLALSRCASARVRWCS